MKKMKEDFEEERRCFRESKLFMMESFNATNMEQMEVSSEYHAVVFSVALFTITLMILTVNEYAANCTSKAN